MGSEFSNPHCFPPYFRAKNPNFSQKNAIFRPKTVIFNQFEPFLPQIPHFGSPNDARIKDFNFGDGVFQILIVFLPILGLKPPILAKKCYFQNKKCHFLAKKCHF